VTLIVEHLLGAKFVAFENERVARRRQAQDANPG
jgi:hypothetical protein